MSRSSEETEASRGHDKVAALGQVADAREVLVCQNAMQEGEADSTQSTETPEEIMQKKYLRHHVEVG